LFIDEHNREFNYVTIVVGDVFCCPSEGFELRLTGDAAARDGFPAQNTRIEVVGVLGRYEELGRGFLYLAVDELTILG
jgi:hypothetical protein